MPLKKNLFTLPSSIAIYLLLLVPAQSIIEEAVLTKHIDQKKLIDLLFFATSISLQQVLRYSEDGDEALFTPKFIPGRDKDKPWD